MKQNDQQPIQRKGFLCVGECMYVKPNDGMCTVRDTVDEFEGLYHFVSFCFVRIALVKKREKVIWLYER